MLDNIRPLYPKVGGRPPVPSLAKLNQEWNVASAEDDTDMKETFCGEPSSKKFQPSSTGINGIRYEMEHVCDQCVEAYCDLAGVDRKCVTPKRP